ncbi:hypothetical protein H0H92_004400 [Tricholoma furcatifolium]|nr:hypothetical protein H0H92_004400 [Tricholoma furcatifolium]
MNAENVQPLGPLKDLEDPDYFYNYVTRLLDTNLHLGHNETINSKQEIWVTVLLGLSQFMVFPPMTSTLSWKILSRRVEMVEKWMELVERASTRIVGLFTEPGNLAEEVLTKLLGLTCAFWAWNDNDDHDDATYTPQYMREKAMKVMLVVTRVLGDSSSTTPADRRLWQTLRMFLVECLDTVRGFCGPLNSMSYRLLQYHLRNPGLEDVELVTVKEAQSTIPASKTDIVSALKVLALEPIKRTKATVLRFLCDNIPFFDSEMLDAMSDAVSSIALGPRRDEVLLKLEHRKQEITRMKQHDEACQENDASWREKVRNAIQNLYLPDHVMWSDEEDSTSGDQFVEVALHRLNECCHRPLSDTTAVFRVSFAKKLANLVCLLCHCDSSACSVSFDVQMLPLLSSALQGIIHLFDGSEDEVTSELRRLAFAALTRMIRHNSTDRPNTSFGTSLNLIFRGLADKERSVRLGAGNCLATLLHIMSANGIDIEKTFDRLYQLYNSARIPGKESLLLSIGQVGKSPEVEVVGQALCFLIAQLDNPNPVLKGSAYIKIDAIKQATGKSIYSLLGRHVERVAPYLVSRYYTQPDLLTESCRIMGMSTATFVAMTRQHTFPYLFANCDTKVLQGIARLLEVPVSTLYFQEAPQILAHVFQMQGPGQTNKAVEFIEKTMASDLSGGIKVTIQDLLKSSQVQILAEIIIELGNPHKAPAALAALSKIQRVLLPANDKNSRDLATFLKSHTLGIFSQLSDLLQEVKVKVSTERKRTILRSMGALASHVGKAISDYAPQTMVVVRELSEVTLEIWKVFLMLLEPEEIKPYVGPTTAAFIFSWDTFNSNARKLATQSLEYLIREIGEALDHHLNDVVDLATIPDLQHLHQDLNNIRQHWLFEDHLRRIVDHCTSDNLTVAILSLGELKRFLLSEAKLIRQLTSGDIFDPMIGQIMTTLMNASCRDGDGTELLRLLAFESMGILGALDPDRLEISVKDSSMVVIHNFTDETESISFAIHLIRDLLVGVFRATNDVVYQRYLGFTLQELLRVCQFTPSLIGSRTGPAPSVKVRNRWNNLPKHVVETLISLLDSKYSFHPSPAVQAEHPVYPSQSTYREWIQIWTHHLIDKASGPMARNIFASFPPTVRNKDVVVAYHILPHLVLNILISGHDNDAEAIRIELKTVLEDQINPDSPSSPDKKLLSAQAVFMIMDHINKWVRVVRQDIAKKKNEGKRVRDNHLSSLEEQLLRVDSILSSIDQILIARAAFQCKAYARSLMSFERQIMALQEQSPKNADLPDYYERLHEIYSHLDEPDGMEGVSPLILSPSLEHQIRQHESTGRWTSAQSCWEVRLQQAPNNIDFHIGLLRCLRNLGHYGKSLQLPPYTLRTHVKGVLIRNPEWEAALAGFQVESSWMVGAWDEVQDMVDRTTAQTSQIVMARLLLAMRAGDLDKISQSNSVARSILGAPITAAGVRGYRRSYEAVLNLHLMHELEIIQNVLTHLPSASQPRSQQRRLKALSSLSDTLTARFESTLPSYRTREPVLSLRRAAFSLSSVPKQTLAGEHGRSWLASARIARKAGHWQTAYSAMLQAMQNQVRYSFFESAKLVKTRGEPLRALTELENSMKSLGMMHEAEGDVLDLTMDDLESKHMRAKASYHFSGLQILLTSDRPKFCTFTDATQLRPEWESAHFHLGQFHDECFKNLPLAERGKRGLKMNLYTVRSFAKAIKFGSKYVYQTVPRLLTIWLDLGDDKTSAGSDIFKRLNESVAQAILDCPAYKWFTAFPQIVSRVGHSNPEVYPILSRLIIRVMQEYPKQALWLFTSVIKSTKSNRESRGKQILKQLRNNPSNAKTDIPDLIQQSIAMTDQLLNLCDHQIDDDSKKILTISKDFKRLAELGKSPLIIPLQESLTASLPPTSSAESAHQPFPPNAPTFERFFDEIEIMRSLAKPRKITIQGSNGQVYMFLGKPKDDLRKDARLMDFNAIINKLLKANSESRRRQLHIRTYGVVTLNEECGFIQWVPNTIPIRNVIVRYYDARQIRSWNSTMADVFQTIKTSSERDAGNAFAKQILPLFPPVFHDWFIETFSEPTAWLTSRMAYARTAAVMSMVGFIIGLGDRHGENILLDSITGDVVHVDFNCLFEKGKSLETPERVPFRLTQNLIDGLGVTGVEGVFRIACEVTMQLLRDHKDSLMNVLDAFIHDPLVEWEDEKRKLERSERRNQVKASVDLRMLAKNALNPIEKKLKGIYSTSKERHEKEISTSNLVQMLIQEATDMANLARMYPGWAPWH